MTEWKATAEALASRVLARSGPGASDSDFRVTIESVSADIVRSPDDECLELSRAGESRYLEDHALSLWNNVAAIRDALETVSCKSADARLLDIGASPLTMAYHEHFGTLTTALDLTPLLASRFRRKGIDHRVCNLLLQPFPLDDESFDIVVFTEVMEHLPTGPGGVFGEIRRVLRPSGHLIFSLPNVAHLRKRILALLGRPVLDPVYDVFKESEGGQSSGSGEWVHGLGHVREYTLSETRDIVEHYGFSVIRTCCVDSTANAATALIGRVRGLLANGAKSLVPNSRGINIVLARKVMH